MREQQKRIINMTGWIAVMIFVVRCAISWKNILAHFSLYDFYGYASEAICIAVILIQLYEKIIWRFNPLEKTPRLASRYVGVLKSNYDNRERDVILFVKQTLLTVHVTMITDESKSKSLSTSIDEILGEVQLTYSYLNIPKSEYRDRSEIHHGTAILSISNPDEISGQYYTDRKSIGDMYLVADE